MSVADPNDVCDSYWCPAFYCGALCAHLGSVFLDCEACGVLAAYQTWSFPRFVFPVMDCLNVYSFTLGGFFYFFYIYLVSIYYLLGYVEILADSQDNKFLLTVGMVTE